MSAATYRDANFGSIAKKTRTQARPLVSASAPSETAQRGAMDGYAAPVFVAGEPLSITVQDYVVDETQGARLVDHSAIHHAAISTDNDNQLVESVRVIVSTSNGDEEVHPDSICSCKSLRLRNVLVFLPLGYRYLST
jgi:hypothetical protein